MEVESEPESGGDGEKLEEVGKALVGIQRHWRSKMLSTRRVTST